MIMMNSHSLQRLLRCWKIFLTQKSYQKQISFLSITRTSQDQSLKTMNYGNLNWVNIQNLQAGNWKAQRKWQLAVGLLTKPNRESSKSIQHWLLSANKWLIRRKLLIFDCWGCRVIITMQKILNHSYLKEVRPILAVIELLNIVSIKIHNRTPHGVICRRLI